MSLWISESTVNRTENYRIYDSDVYETGEKTLGELYRNCVNGFGRCTGKVYVDEVKTSSGFGCNFRSVRAKPIGWIFVKRVKYDDANETFLQETWISVHSAPDTVTREPHYVEISE